MHRHPSPQHPLAICGRDVNFTRYAVITETTYLKSQSLELFTHKLLRWLSVTWPGARLPLIGLLVLTFDPSVCCDMLTGVWTPGIRRLFHSLLAQPQRQEFACRWGCARRLSVAYENCGYFHHSHEPTIHCDWGNSNLYLDQLITRGWYQPVWGRVSYPTSNPNATV